jgi:hypothetical protein
MNSCVTLLEEFEVSRTVLMESSSFIETISLKEARTKSILVKERENEEKLACVHYIDCSNGVSGFTVNCITDLSR